MWGGARVVEVVAGLCLATPALSMATAVQAPLSHEAISHEGIAGMAPDFTRTDISGRAVHLRGYRGRLVLLNFWATWCEPCLAEIPEFIAWQGKYGASGLQVIGISLDEEAEPVKRAYAKYGLNYPVVIGDAPLAERFGGVLGLPLTLLIGPDGRIVGRYPGGRDLKPLQARIKLLLAGS